MLFCYCLKACNRLQIYSVTAPLKQGTLSCTHWSVSQIFDEVYHSNNNIIIAFTSFTKTLTLTTNNYTIRTRKIIFKKSNATVPSRNVKYGPQEKKGPFSKQIHLEKKERVVSKVKRWQAISQQWKGS